MDFFNNESETIQIGDLTIENRKGRVQIYGSIERSKKGLNDAYSLLVEFNEILLTLKHTSNLPDTLSVEGENVEVVENPFDGGDK